MRALMMAWLAGRFFQREYLHHYDNDVCNDESESGSELERQWDWARIFFPYWSERVKLAQAQAK